MARNSMTNQGNRSYLDNRRQVINASQPQINGKNLDEFQRQQEKVITLLLHYQQYY